MVPDLFIETTPKLRAAARVNTIRPENREELCRHPRDWVRNGLVDPFSFPVD
ncbi:hypothetical protein RBSH_03194 [Rhodopirellula baltica SH28]|uniref:Uncharacterized protein n=3 Tax=Rhodopirellula baltica TaxID=265606 RepID=F2ANL3_RHOBT|nr:hypothetical protein RBWH47_03791 [Rhodopirellula baltica WH47]EKK01528.1 hypothetical protein RBSH_03194 [Rhodopirellula baltica SH28]ELP29973.1 hypothetical protein RBSWK_06061 [Rhodopirellula baltica SWK14]